MSIFRLVYIFKTSLFTQNEVVVIVMLLCIYRLYFNVYTKWGCSYKLICFLGVWVTGFVDDLKFVPVFRIGTVLKFGYSEGWYYPLYNTLGVRKFYGKGIVDWYWL